MDISSGIESQDFGDVIGLGRLDEPTKSGEEWEVENERPDETVSQSGSARLSSGPDEDVFDDASQKSSPRTSQPPSDASDNEESWITQNKTPSPYTPLKTRIPFRNPSSVRAMQTDITPPHLSSSHRSQRYSFHTPSRRDTPRSARSSHNMSSPSKMSPGKRMQKEYPLVLLHVTLLPLPSKYSTELLEAALPPTIAANWNLLQEKIAQTILERGILIPHPREDYDLLEERLLESLELKIPRLLKCGHFHLSPEEEADVLETEIDDESENEDADLCEDCGRRIRDGRFGDAGTGSKRWDIKIFAANGLMRAGAWGAAWREMERVDVEIRPWMEENMKVELEMRKEEEERLRTEEEEAAKEEGIAGLDDERLREIYGQSTREDGVDAKDDHSFDRRSKSGGTQEETPLLDLTMKFLRMAARDRRNIAILLLSIIVLCLSMRNPAAPTSLSTASTMVQEGHDVPIEVAVPRSVPDAVPKPQPDVAITSSGSDLDSDSHSKDQPLAVSMPQERTGILERLGPMVATEEIVGEIQEF